jgi:hypothetical protein
VLVLLAVLLMPSYCCRVESARVPNCRVAGPWANLWRFRLRVLFRRRLFCARAACGSPFQLGVHLRGVTTKSERVFMRPALPLTVVMTDGTGRQVQVQVQVCFTSVCGQVQPLDVALSNSASTSHSHAIAVPGCSSALAGKLCTNEAIGAAKCSAVNRV